MKKVWIIETIAFITILLFLYTGINKLLEFSTFRAQIALSPALEPFADTIVWLLPMMEFTIALLLFLPSYRLIGFGTALILMTLFTVYVSIILTMDKNIPCSCGGIIQSLSWSQHLIVNSLFVLLEFMGLRLQKSILRVNKTTTHSA